MEEIKMQTKEELKQEMKNDPEIMAELGKIFKGKETITLSKAEFAEIIIEFSATLIIVIGEKIGGN